MEKIVVYPGTFDPITLGHLDVIKRALRLFDRVIVSVGTNAAKTTRFTQKERVSMIAASIEALNGAEVQAFDGLLVDHARAVGACGILRGIRALTDYDYEFQLAGMNRSLAENIETIFVTPSAEYTYVSSTIVREVARLGGDVSAFVPKAVLAFIQASQ